MADDLFGIADQINELARWDPDAEELPIESLEDPDWLRSRQLARQFISAEMDELRARFLREAELLKARQAELPEPRAAELAGRAGQLIQLLRAKQAEALRLGRVPPTSIDTPQGSIVSKPPGVKKTVEVVDEEKAIAWLQARDLDGYLRHTAPKPATTHPDIVKLRKAIAGDKIVDENGESCEHLRVNTNEPKYEVHNPTTEHTK